MIKKIVLTGGPGSGKTTVLDKIKQVYTMQGIKVLIVQETATELINSGVSFLDGTISLLDFQELVLRLQLYKEEIIDRTLEYSKKDDILVIYDRGTIDNSAYVSKEEFEEVLARLNHEKSFSDLMNHYDLVIDLVGREDFYTTENNKARSESVDEALNLGNKTLQSWVGHRKVRIVKPKDTIDEKINEVLNIINELIDKKEVKRQEKYSVDLSRTDLDYVYKNSKVATIEQVYLDSEESEEKRLRRIVFNDSVSYVFSVYKKLTNGEKVIVFEKHIDEATYNALMEFRNKKYGIIKKKRYYFAYDGEYFYLDIFADNKDIGILEINVMKDEVINIPEFIATIENVTRNESYYNKMIAFREGKRIKYDKDIYRTNA